MKTLIIDATAVGERITGLERYAIEISQRLASLKIQEGWNVTILVQAGKRIWWERRAPEISDLFLESPFRSRLATQQVWIPGMVWRARADIAFFPGFPPSPLVFRLKRTRVVRTIFDAVLWAAPETLSLKNRMYYRLLEKYGAARYSKVHTISTHAADELTQHVKRLACRLVVSGCGVTALPAAGEKRDGLPPLEMPFLLSVGTLEPRKNLPFLVNVFGELRRRHPEFRLVLAGRFGWGYDEVKDAIKLAGQEEHVQLTGSISDAALADLYRTATALLFPSLYEGFGLPVVEAMAAGLPVISSNTSALPEVCGDAAILLDPMDRNGWIEAIERLIVDAGLQRQMADAGRVQAARFTWDQVAMRVGDAL